MRKFTLLLFFEKGHLWALIGCSGFPADGPSENPLPQHHFTNDSSSFNERWGSDLRKSKFC